MAAVYIYLLLFGMTNFTPKMTHAVSVFDLIAFIIIIINDNNSTALMPQGPSWDQGSVLIGIEHTKKTNLALRSLHLSWRRQVKCREKEVVLSLSCPKTERLSDLLEVRQVFGGRGSTGAALKAPKRWGGQVGTRLSSPSQVSLLMPGENDCKLAAGHHWKYYEREVASTEWRWEAVPGHVPACMTGPPYFVLQHNKPNIPSVQGFEP